MRNLENISDEECYEIAVLENWKYCWEMDDLECGGTRDYDEMYNALVERGRDIVKGKISGDWVNFERVNNFILSKGYPPLNTL